MAENSLEVSVACPVEDCVYKATKEQIMTKFRVHWEDKHEGKLMMNGNKSYEPYYEAVRRRLPPNMGFYCPISECKIVRDEACKIMAHCRSKHAGEALNFALLQVKSQGGLLPLPKDWSQFQLDPAKIPLLPGFSFRCPFQCEVSGMDSKSAGEHWYATHRQYTSWQVYWEPLNRQRDGYLKECLNQLRSPQSTVTIPGLAASGNYTTAPAPTMQHPASFNSTSSQAQGALNQNLAHGPQGPQQGGGTQSGGTQAGYHFATSLSRQQQMHTRGPPHGTSQPHSAYGSRRVRNPELVTPPSGTARRGRRQPDARARGPY